MSSLSSIVYAHGPIKFGDPLSEDVRVLQQALSSAGYRIGVDGEFGNRTRQVVKQFQQQHGLNQDAIVGIKTAALLDVPHEVLVKTAQGITSAVPLVHPDNPENWIPHDDTASLIAFYGDPRGDLEGWKQKFVTAVPCPWTIYYEGKVWPHPIQIHKRIAVQLAASFAAIWEAAGQDDSSSILTHVRHFSGSGEYREVRGSSRLSCHAFWAAIDWDAEHLPMRYPGQERFKTSDLPEPVYDAFRKWGFFCGVDFTGRQDAMHIQYANE